MENKVMKVTDWLLTLFISYLPLVGIIMLFVWAFGSDDNLSRRNWARAQLIISLIMGVLGAIFSSVLIGFLATYAANMA
jgi:ABC-type Fe3+ transport system permease subunit